MKRRLYWLGIIIFSMILLNGCNNNEKKVSDKNKEFKIVTSFYPIYNEVLNITKNIEDVKIVNMVNNQTGCLHDYSLTPADLKTINDADVFVINGVGMESFIKKILDRQPNLKIINASKDINLIKNIGEDGDNPHVWMSIKNSIIQINNISKELAKADKKNEEKYYKNSNEYIKKLDKLSNNMHIRIANLKSKDIITFHEAFPYFAEEFALNIKAIIEREPGSEPTPKELKDTIATIKKSKIKALFAEPQYPDKSAKTIAKASGAKVYILDPIVTGDNNPNTYIKKMESNLKSLEEALK